MDEGETLEIAAVREAKEESGLDVAIVRKISTMVIKGYDYVGAPVENERMIEVNIFEGARITTNIQKGVEELDARWCSKEDLEQLKLRWAFLKEILLSLG